MYRRSWSIVEVGKADIIANSGLPMAGFAKNVSFFAVDLRHAHITRKEVTQKLLGHTMRLLDSGDICCPNPIHTFRVSAMEDVFRFLQSGKSIGRIVIESDFTDIVPVGYVILVCRWS